MFTLYHCADARSLRPLWALEEIGLDYELKLLPFPPRVFAKEYLAINPLGTIPFFVDGDAKMTESSGICAYLVAKYGPTPLEVTPSEPDYAAYLNWLFFSDATLTFPQTIVLRYSRLEPEERRLPQAVEDYGKWFLGRLKAVESVLADREYLVGKRFTIADICIAYALHLADSLPPLSDRLPPHSRAYMERLRQRPAFQRAMVRQKG